MARSLPVARRQRSGDGTARHATPAELLAVDGEIAWWWFDQSCDVIDDGPYDVGVATSLVIAEDRHASRLAHLRLSYARADKVDAYRADPITYQADHNGWCLPDDPAQRWVRAHHYARCVPASLAERGAGRQELGAADADGADIAADMAALGARYRRDVETWAADHAQPFVAYAHVDDDHRRRGLATRAYVLAARRLATSGQYLRASTLRSNDALGLWEHLVADPTIPTVYVSPRHGSDDLVPAIDYRSEDAPPAEGVLVGAASR